MDFYIIKSKQGAVFVKMVNIGRHWIISIPSSKDRRMRDCVLTLLEKRTDLDIQEIKNNVPTAGRYFVLIDAVENSDYTFLGDGPTEIAKAVTDFLKNVNIELVSYG